VTTKEKKNGRQHDEHPGGSGELFHFWRIIYTLKKRIYNEKEGKEQEAT